MSLITPVSRMPVRLMRTRWLSQLTRTLETSAPATVPVPPVRMQVCAGPVGWARILSR